ncbi:MAG: general secretion pathway protein GspM [archaeon]|nr:general secretion pathway protein GspM [archaeon]
MFNISRREKNILIWGTLFVVLFFGFQFGIAPVFDRKENLTRILKDKQTALEEMSDLQQQFLALSNRFDVNNQALMPEKTDFSLFSFLDSLVQQSNIKENVVYMKPLTKKLEKSKYIIVIVKVKLKDLHLKEFIDFLYRMESSGKHVVITSLSLSKSGKDKQRLDAVLETQTFKLNGKV